MENSKNDQLFLVSFDDIPLSEEQMRSIDKGIKEVVMRELAQIDNQGDLIINNKLAGNPRLKELNEKLKGSRTLGIWVGKKI